MAVDALPADDDVDARPHVPRSGTRQPAPDASRATSIRDAALELFATKSYRATTMEDIGVRVGVRGPSLYKHVGSKHELLAEIMLTTMQRLLADHRVAIGTTSERVEQLRRAAEAHARYHARHQLEAFVGNREIDQLEEPIREQVLSLRRAYERGFRELIESGVAAGLFTTASPRLASYAILDMGMGIARWFRGTGSLTEDQVAYAHGDFALRIVGAVPGPVG